MSIKHWFIPTKQNKFHPHILRATGMLLVLAVLVIIPPIYNMSSVGKTQILGYAVNINTNDVFIASNQERIKAGLDPLTINNSLVYAATAKANHMFANNYWAHIAPDGTTPWSFIITSGYSYSTAGENLAKGFNTSVGVVDGWMGSPTHKANVLNVDFKDVGYAAVNGTLLGEDVTLVVAMYGTQSEENTVAITEPSKTTTTPTPETDPSDQTTAQTEEKTDEITPIVSVSDKAQTGSTKDTETKLSDVAGAFILLPVKVYNSFNWGQKASLLILSTMVLLFIMKHTLIWRQQKKGLRNIWLRAHPIGQAIVLGISIMIILANSIGVVL